VVGFLLPFPDVSRAFQKNKGKLGPIEIIRLLAEIKKTNWIDFNGIGILPEAQGFGGNALIYEILIDSVHQNSRYQHGELTQVAETAVQMRKDLLNLGCVFYKNHRVYQKNDNRIGGPASEPLEAAYDRLRFSRRLFLCPSESKAGIYINLAPTRTETGHFAGACLYYLGFVFCPPARCYAAHASVHVHCDRFLLGAITLLPLLLFSESMTKAKTRTIQVKKTDQNVLKAGLFVCVEACYSLGRLFSAIWHADYPRPPKQVSSPQCMSSWFLCLAFLSAIRVVRKAVWLGVLLAVAGVYLLSFH
jgi:hypothetical protein